MAALIHLGLANNETILKENDTDILNPTILDISTKLFIKSNAHDFATLMQKINN